MALIPDLAKDFDSYFKEHIDRHYRFAIKSEFLKLNAEQQSVFYRLFDRYDPSKNKTVESLIVHLPACRLTTVLETLRFTINGGDL